MTSNSELDCHNLMALKLAHRLAPLATPVQVTLQSRVIFNR